MATAEKGKSAPQAEPERKFPLWPLIGAVVAFVVQRVSQRPEFNMWLYRLAIGLVGVASLYHLAPRKNGKVVVTPFSLDVYGPLAVGAFIAVASYQWVKDDNTASTVTLTLSLGAFAVIAWGYYLAAQKRARDFQLLRDRLLVVIGLGAALGYANFGHLHFNNFIHTWDTYHYYIGAKYFPEVGYDRMYECAITADAEDFPAAKLEKMREQRIVTNLRTNIMEKVGETILNRNVSVVGEPGPSAATESIRLTQACKTHFTPERWTEFKKDIAFFRSRVNDKRWEEIHHDHGYNASPVWTLLGHVITNTGTATLDQVTFVDLFDPLYLALMAAMVWWAFGPRVFALAMLMIGCNWASRFFYWTGGALLRHDWLFYTVAVVCLLRKGKPFMAGVALAYASLLRLFPGLLVVGPVLAAIEYARVRIKAKGDVPDDEAKTAEDTETRTFFWVRYAALSEAQKSIALRNLGIVVAPPAALALYLLSKDAQLGRIAMMLVAGAVALVGVLQVLEVLCARAFAKAPRWLDPVFARFVVGGLIATVILAGMSFHFFGGVETWKRFAQNTAKHAATPLTNSMGLKTVLVSPPWTSGSHLRDSKVLDAWQPWKDARIEVFKYTRPFFFLACLAGLVMLYLALRGWQVPLWAAAAMGTGFIVVAAELTNYYYVFFVAIATLYELRREVGMWLSLLVATCIFIMLTPIPGMSGWQDEQSVAMSIASVIAVGGIWWTFSPWGRKIVVEPEPAPQLFPELVTAPAAAAAGKKKKR